MSYSIKIAFCQETSPDFISKSIMFFLKKPYSHVMCIFEDTDGKEKIFHSIGKGTCVDETMEYLKTHKIVRQFRVPMKVTKEQFIGYVQGRCGREYSNTQYFNMALEYLGIKWIPFKNGAAKAVCSEEISALAPMADLDIPEGMELDLIDPKEVDDFLSGQKKAQLEI